MVFDSATCSWHALSGPDAEDELDLDWGEVADDEEGGEGDGWEKGERERMLKNRASFVLSEGEEGSSEEEGKKGKMTKRGIWRESKRAEERCKKEMKDWIVREEEGKEEDRSWLFELRAVRFKALRNSHFFVADLSRSSRSSSWTLSSHSASCSVCFPVSFAVSFVVSTLFRNFHFATLSFRIFLLPYFVITLLRIIPLAIYDTPFCALPLKLLSDFEKTLRRLRSFPSTTTFRPRFINNTQIPACCTSSRLARRQVTLLRRLKILSSTFINFQFFRHPTAPSAYL